MLHHVSLGVRDVVASGKFYDAVLGALGLKRKMDFSPRALAYGDGGMQSFWIQQPHDGKAPSAGNGVHIAFAAKTEKEVQEFYMAALAQGGSDDGAPGPRPHYGPAYYGAFVRDPDGNKVEAMLVPTPAAASLKDGTGAMGQTRTKKEAKRSKAAPKKKRSAKVTKKKAAKKKKARR